MENPKLTSSLEDYLETIYVLVQEHQHARVRDIAKARDVKPSSVSPALKRLSEMGLVTHVQREYVRLTPAGEQAARRVYSRHQLLMRFFQEVLHMEPVAAEEQACVMEHNLSDEAMDRMVRFFEFLTVCPGAPNDFLERFAQCGLGGSGTVACGLDNACAAGSQTSNGENHMCLADLKPGETAKVKQVNAQGAIRQRLLDMGLLPDVTLRVERVAPAGDPVWISLQGAHIALRKHEAEAVNVKAGS